MRWDRVSVLLALITGLAVVIGHAVITSPHPDAARVTAIAPAPVVRVTPPADRPPACRAPKTNPVRTAPTGPRAKSTKTVALTFDDGPGPWTSDVLAVLRQQHLHATFFMIGRRAAADPRAVRQVATAGHLVGNHTWTHPYRTTAQGWTSAGLTTEIHRTQTILTDLTGQRPCFFRPPGGVLKGARGPTRRAGLSIALWSVDTRDWSGQRSTDRRFAAVIRQRARAGLGQQHPVILLHDGGGYRGKTAAALPGIIADYRSAGYTFVRLDGRS